MVDHPKASDAQQRADRVGRFIEAGDRAAQALGIRLCEMWPGYALMEMVVRPDMVNAAGTCQGGVLFTLADTAFACACNSHNELTVAAGCSIEFLLPGQVGDLLRAEAVERILVKRTGVYDVTIKRQDDVVVALFRGKSHRLGGRVVENA